VSQINKLKIFNDPMGLLPSQRFNLRFNTASPYFQRHKTYFADGIVISGLSRIINNATYHALGLMYEAAQ
jgi:hypothetical protein